MKLPNLSIAAKLYLIFALLATVTVALASVAAFNARRHAALTDEFRSAFAGALNVELVNGLIYAVVMESRGIYMSSDIPTAKVYGDGLLVFNDRIGEVVNEWQHAVRSDDEALFKAFSQRIRQFQEFRRELVRRGVEINPAAGREWGDNDANRSVRKALNEDLTKLGQLYASRSERSYKEIDEGIERTAWLIAVIAIATVVLAGLGAVIIARGVARPLARITRITQAVASGEVERVVPYGERHDEVGALARSIEVFQQTIRKNEELNRTVVDDAQARARRQEELSREIGRFGGEVEATLSELGRISDQMLAAASRLTEAADNASSRTSGAAAASQISGMQHATARSIEAIGAIERTIRNIGEITGTIAAAVTEQGAATQEIARSVETAAVRTSETAQEVVRVGEATAKTRESAMSVKMVADDLGAVAGRIRGQVDHFFAKLHAA